MKKATAWGTWSSLLIVLAACVAIAWRLSPSSRPQPEAGGAAPAATPDAVAARAAPAPAREKELHAKATVRSPLETILQTDAPPPEADAGARPVVWTYRLNHPANTRVLPRVLDEISDLSTADDGQSLWAINDERGTVYRLGLKDGAVVQTINFGRRDDYEAVAQVDGGVLVGRSDGLLFLVNPLDAGATNIATNLGSACNLQGLAYEPNRRRMLLSCKAAMPKLPKSRKSFAVYAMNLGTARLQREPVIVLPEQAIDDYLGTHPNQSELAKSMGDEFAPTAIAVHPSSGEIYVLSARGTMLVVLEPNGSLERVEGLDPRVHPQPEGICFGANGTLYISNKARGGARAVLHSYDPVRVSDPAR